MPTALENRDQLRQEVRRQIDVLETDELREIKNTLARLAGMRAVQEADRLWDNGQLSAEAVARAVRQVRQAKKTV